MGGCDAAAYGADAINTERCDNGPAKSRAGQKKKKKMRLFSGGFPLLPFKKKKKKVWVIAIKIDGFKGGRKVKCGAS